MKTTLTPAEERHHAFLAYRLGYAAAALPGEAQRQWEVADPGDPVPDALLELFRYVEDATDWPEAPRAFGGKRKAKTATSGLRQAHGQERAAVERGWGSEEQAEYIAFRQFVDSELDAEEARQAWPDAPHPYVPVAGQLWQTLSDAARGLWLKLPAGLGRWAELGAAVGLLLSRGTRQALLDARYRLPALHSRLAGAPFLGGVPLDLSHEGYWAYFADVVAGRTAEGSRLTRNGWEVRQLVCYHGEVLARLGQPAEPGAPAAGPADEPPARRAGLSRTMAAAALALEHPTWTVGQIAEAAGCNRGHLYRSPQFVQALRSSRSGRATLPRGTYRRGRDGSRELEAVDESGRPDLD